MYISEWRGNRMRTNKEQYSLHDREVDSAPDRQAAEKVDCS